MIRLRNAKPADARAIARIHVETWRTTYPGMLPDRALIDMNIDGKARSWRNMLEKPETGRRCAGGGGERRGRHHRLCQRLP